jgi:hypothetical protein
MEVIASTRKLLTYLPQNSWDKKESRVWTENDEENQPGTHILNNLIP